MQTLIRKSTGFFTTILCSLLLIVITNSCKKNNSTVSEQSFSQVNLVASSSSYAGARVDPNLINGWGIAFGSTGTAWISANGRNVSLVYDQAGSEKLTPVSIPSAILGVSGSPTGQVFNASADFVLPLGGSAKFLFCTTDGIIAGWNTGLAAVKVVDRSATSVYLGLAMATVGTQNYLYAADFKSGKIDVFNKNFTMMSMAFTDPTLPTGYSPFNIQNINGQLFVMYAKRDESSGDEEKGAGFGYVDIFNADGTFVTRFASQGTLNAPWGIAAAPSGFVNSSSDVILIGNFGNGMINAYDRNGNYLGPLKSGGTPIVIDGLWGISFAPPGTGVANQLFFAAGPSDETAGLFGYIKN